MTKKRAIAFAIGAILLSGSGVVAQSNDAQDIRKGRTLSPTDPHKGNVNGPESRGAGTGENKPSATGGQPDGGTDRN